MTDEKKSEKRGKGEEMKGEDCEGAKICTAERICVSTCPSMQGERTRSVFATSFTK